MENGASFLSLRLKIPKASLSALVLCRLIRCLCLLVSAPKYFQICSLFLPCTATALAPCKSWNSVFAFSGFTLLHLQMMLHNLITLTTFGGFHSRKK